MISADSGVVAAAFASWHESQAIASRTLAGDVRLPLAELASLGIVGGAVYDGLICATAREAEAALVTLDPRAATTYDRFRVGFRLLET